ARMRALVDERQLHLVFGGTRRSSRARRLSALLLEPAELRAVYDKQRLVPFAEAWPGWIPVALRAHLGQLAPPRPPPPAPLRAPGRSGCWESAFSAPSGDPGAGPFVTLWNAGWYDDTPAAPQALRAARWRALERGAWLLRAASTGISAVIAPDGRIAASLRVG